MGGGMKNKIRFSYVEVMVVAIVLGIAGKMIAPQFTEASSEEARVSKLVDGLR
jgi:type II secretory pathway pseudopilin PulG